MITCLPILMIRFLSRKAIWHLFVLSAMKPNEGKFKLLLKIRKGQKFSDALDENL